MLPGCATILEENWSGFREPYVHVHISRSTDIVVRTVHLYIAMTPWLFIYYVVILSPIDDFHPTMLVDVIQRSNKHRSIDSDAKRVPRNSRISVKNYSRTAKRNVRIKMQVLSRLFKTTGTALRICFPVKNSASPFGPFQNNTLMVMLRRKINS